MSLKWKTVLNNGLPKEFIFATFSMCFFSVDSECQSPCNAKLGKVDIKYITYENLDFCTQKQLIIDFSY